MNHIKDCRQNIPGLQQSLAVIIAESNTIGAAATIWNEVRRSGLENCMAMDESGKKSGSEEATRIGSRTLRENKLVMVELVRTALKNHKMVFHANFCSGFLKEKYRPYNSPTVRDTRDYVPKELKNFMRIKPVVPETSRRIGTRKVGYYFSGKETGVKTDDFVDDIGMAILLYRVFNTNVKYSKYWY